MFPFSDTYARTAAEGMLASLEHYGHRCPAVGDGEMATPAHYANRLGKVLNSRRDALPGKAADWWGDRWAAYARHLLTMCPAA
jgi:hypothetical protein